MLARCLGVTLPPVSSCCNPRGCERFFTGRFARRMARRYRKKGLDKTALVMVGVSRVAGNRGCNSARDRRGVGEIQVEGLKHGASHAVNSRCSPAYDDEAALLLRDANLQERAERLLHDIAVDPDADGSADVVVLHRVVCCYPDYERLLD